MLAILGALFSRPEAMLGPSYSYAALSPMNKPRTKRHHKTQCCLAFGRGFKRYESLLHSAAWTCSTWVCWANSSCKGKFSTGLFTTAGHGRHGVTEMTPPVSRQPVPTLEVCHAWSGMLAICPDLDNNRMARAKGSKRLCCMTTSWELFTACFYKRQLKLTCVIWGRMMFIQYSTTQCQTWRPSALAVGERLERSWRLRQQRALQLQEGMCEVREAKQMSKMRGGFHIYILMRDFRMIWFHSTYFSNWLLRQHDCKKPNILRIWPEEMRQLRKFVEARQLWTGAFGIRRLSRKRSTTRANQAVRLETAEV